MTRRLIDRDKDLDEQDRLLSIISAKFSKKYEKELLSASKKGIDLFEQDSIIEPDVIDDHKNNIKKILDENYKIAILIGGERMLNILKKTQLQDSPLDETKEENIKSSFESNSRQYIESNSEPQANEISDTTYTRIESAENQTNKEGISKKEQGALMLSLLREQIPARSIIISDTTTHEGLNEGNINMATIGGAALFLALNKEWLTQRDGKVRGSHRIADGQKKGLREPFFVGGEYLKKPGDPSGSPENVINCRCFIGYTVLR
jgi:hypothetical protein